MTITTKDLQSLTAIAISAAKEAGTLVQSYANQPFSIMTKTGGNSEASQVLTEVDLKSQEVILKYLHPTCKSHDLALLTEETPDDRGRLEKEAFWCIDPIDGTLPFTERSPGYAVSIALVSKSGTPLIGVVYNPVDQTMYHSIKNNGLFRNGHPWNPQFNKPDLTHSTVLHIFLDRSFLKHSNYNKWMDTLDNLTKEKGFNTNTIVHHQGAVMNACSVLEHAPAIYFKPAKPELGGGSLWDFAATAALFKEARTIVRDMSGKELDLNRADSTFMNHRGILYTTDEKLAEIIKQCENLITNHLY
jgi:myo-inositol-1(or 4)-monophosphatase